jgi:hypothetical protein
MPTQSQRSMDSFQKHCHNIGGPLISSSKIPQLLSVLLPKEFNLMKFSLLEVSLHNHSFLTLHWANHYVQVLIIGIAYTLGSRIIPMMIMDWNISDICVGEMGMLWSYHLLIIWYQRTNSSRLGESYMVNTYSDYKKSGE